MKGRFLPIILVAVIVSLLGGVAFAQLSSFQRASGSINVTSSVSADLYICEPNSTGGPDCGADDSGADELVFETVEDMLPGNVIQWDIRLKNIGTEDWMVVSAEVDINETLDPGNDCGVIDIPLRPPVIRPGPYVPGITILVDGGDNLLGENGVGPRYSDQGVAVFLAEGNYLATSDFFWEQHIKVAPGGFEDLRLRLELDQAGTTNCDGNEWDVGWTFHVSPVS